ncbi:MAG: hypothetical protein MK180_12515 [Rhodobacteraceae bacterium]|nr:hypothetical protein [Paracoccaceae bacterium]
MTLFAQLKTSIEKHREYNRTVLAIRSMPLDVALDLDIYPGDAKKIAARAVYGY